MRYVVCNLIDEYYVILYDVVVCLWYLNAYISVVSWYIISIGTTANYLHNIHMKSYSSCKLIVCLAQHMHSYGILVRN